MGTKNIQVANYQGIDKRYTHGEFLFTIKVGCDKCRAKFNVHINVKSNIDKRFRLNDAVRCPECQKYISYTLSGKTGTSNVKKGTLVVIK